MSIYDDNKNASVEKLANSLVLGTSVARLVGSSPTRRTIIKKNSDITYMSVFFDMLRCVACCVNKLFNNKGKEKLAIRLDFCTCTSLRKMCQLLQLWRTSKNSLIPTLFLFKSTNRCIYTSAGVYATYATYPTQQTTSVGISEHNRKK